MRVSEVAVKLCSRRSTAGSGVVRYVVEERGGKCHTVQARFRADRVTGRIFFRDLSGTSVRFRPTERRLAHQGGAWGRGEEGVGGGSGGYASCSMVACPCDVLCSTRHKLYRTVGT